VSTNCHNNVKPRSGRFRRRRLVKHIVHLLTTTSDHTIFMSKSIRRTSTTIDDITRGLAELLSRTISPAPLLSVACCCKKNDCKTTLAWNTARAKAEQTLVLSAGELVFLYICLFCLRFTRMLMTLVKRSGRLYWNVKTRSRDGRNLFLVRFVHLPETFVPVIYVHSVTSG